MCPTAGAAGTMCTNTKQLADTASTASVPECLAIAQADSQCLGFIYVVASEKWCRCGTDGSCSSRDTYSGAQVYDCRPTAAPTTTSQLVPICDRDCANPL